MMNVKGLEFSTAWPERVEAEFEDISILLLSKQHLLVSMTAAGRPQDMIDADHLRQSDEI